MGNSKDGGKKQAEDPRTYSMQRQLRQQKNINGNGGWGKRQGK